MCLIWFYLQNKSCINFENKGSILCSNITVLCLVLQKLTCAQSQMLCSYNDPTHLIMQMTLLHLTPWLNHTHPRKSQKKHFFRLETSESGWHYNQWSEKYWGSIEKLESFKRLVLFNSRKLYNSCQSILRVVRRSVVQKNKVLCKQFPIISGLWKIFLGFFKIHLDKAMTDLFLWPWCKKLEEMLPVVPSRYATSAIQWNMPGHCKSLALLGKIKWELAMTGKTKRVGMDFKILRTSLSVLLTLLLWLKLLILLNQREKCLQVVSVLHNIITKSKRNTVILLWWTELSITFVQFFMLWLKEKKNMQLDEFWWFWIAKSLTSCLPADYYKV